MKITFRPLDDMSEASDRRAFVERCCVVLTDRYDSIDPADLPPDDHDAEVHLDVSLCTDRRFRPPTALPPLATSPAVIAVPIRVQYLPRLIHDDRALEHLCIGAVLVGVGGRLRRNPALCDAARRPLEAMGSEGVSGLGPADV